MAAIDLRESYDVDAHLERVALLEALADPSLVLFGMLLELDAEDFAWPPHRSLFNAIREQADAKMFSGLDGLALVFRDLRTRHGVEVVNEMLEYLALSNHLRPRSVGQMEAMIRAIRAMRRKREGKARVSEGAIDLESAPSPLVGPELESISSDLAELASDLGQVVAMAQGEDVARETFDAITQPQERGKRRIFTGIREFDDVTGGLDLGLYAIIGARPGVGKTSFAKGIVIAALEQGMSVYVALAEGDRQVFMRGLLSQVSGVSFTRIMRSTLTESEKVLLRKGVEFFRGSRLEICDTPRLTPSQITNRVRKLVASSGVDLVVVDYLQRLELPRMDVREQAVAAASREFAALASESKSMVLVLAQLNRALDAREDKIPRLTDLRESGSLEQDADMVVFLHRPAALDAKLDPREATVCVAKLRYGSPGVRPISFDPTTTKFISRIDPNATLPPSREAAW